MAARRRRRRKNKNGTLFFCIVVEIIAVLALIGILRWPYSQADRISQKRKPVVQELHISRINISHEVQKQAQSHIIIGEIGGEEIIYPASMTKIMTAIVAIEELSDLEQEITLTSDMFAGLYERDATQAGFQPDETVRAIDLLYGVMLPSGAECCIALADSIAGSEEGFVELMNQKAEKLGMDGTHFCDTTGLHDPDHYSTAKDIAILLKYAIRNDTFREIIESPYHSTPGTNIHPDGITFYSSMFNHLPDPTVTGGKILGGKTGFTNDAGLCLASYAEIDGTEYILVTAGAFSAGTPHIDDAVTIYNRLGEAALALHDE